MFNSIAFIGLLFFTFILFVLSLNGKLTLPVLGAAIGLPLIALMFKYPKLWLWTLAISSFEFFRTSDLKIGVGDILFGIFIIAGTYIWLFWKILVQREKIVYSIADWLIVLFYIGMVLNLSVAMMNNVKFLDWFREFTLFSNILLYFPFRYYLKDKKDIITILVLFGISVGLSAADQVRMYREIALSQAVYAYQLGKSVRLNQPLFTVAIFFSMILSLLPMKKIYRILLWGLGFLSTAALIVSFSRSFWVFVVFAFILMLFYLNKHNRTVFLIGLVIISLAGTVTLFTVFKEKADLMIAVLENRVLSTTKGTKDVSLELRLIEYDEALKQIEKHPWFGNGLGNKINFYVPFMHISTHTKYIHNGYLFTMFRMGIPLTIVLVTILIYFFITGEKLARKLKEPFYKYLVLVSSVSLLMLMASSMLSNQFFQRDAGVIIALSFAFISNTQTKIRNKLIS